MTSTLIPETAISLPFQIDARGNILRTSDDRKLWGDRVRAAVGTLRGERLFMSNYGSEIPLHSFDPMRSVEEVIQEDIYSVFSTELPLLKLKDVFVNVSDETINIEILYELPNEDNVTTEIGFATVTGAGPISEDPI